MNFLSFSLSDLLLLALRTLRPDSVRPARPELVLTDEETETSDFAREWPDSSPEEPEPFELAAGEGASKEADAAAASFPSSCEGRRGVAIVW